MNQIEAAVGNNIDAMITALMRDRPQGWGFHSATDAEKGAKQALGKAAVANRDYNVLGRTEFGWIAASQAELKQNMAKHFNLEESTMTPKQNTSGSTAASTSKPVMNAAAKPIVRESAADDKAEAEAKRLGFKFNEKTKKWCHPDSPEYSATKAKNAVEDYPDIKKNKEKASKMKANEAKAPLRKKRMNEAETMEKTRYVLAAQAIPDELQAMAEKLAKIEADKLMPLQDSLKMAVGAPATDRFSQTVTSKVRELLDAVKAGKDAIDAQIANLQSVANGEPGNDMASDLAAPGPDLAADPAATAPGDDMGAPDADMDAAAPDPALPDIQADASADTDDLPLDDAGGAAGRLRKESTSRKMTPAIRALREAKNPDAVVLKTFREHLSKARGKGKVMEAVLRTARTYEIDGSDVVSIVTEAKASAGRPLAEKAGKPATKSFRDLSRTLAEKLLYRAKWNPETHWFDIVDMNGKIVAKDVAVNDDRAKALARRYKPGMVIETDKASTEKASAAKGEARNAAWVGKTLNTAKVNHKVEGGTVWVGNASDAKRANTAMKNNPALTGMPVKVRESIVREATPVRPMTPGDMRAAQQQKQDNASFAKQQQQQQTPTLKDAQAPVRTPGMSGPKSQVAPTNTAANNPAGNSGTAPQLPGKVMKTVPKVVPPASAAAKASKPNNPGQNGEPGEQMTDESAADGTETGTVSPDSPIDNAAQTAPAAPAVPPNTLFSKITPLPKPKSDLMGNTPNAPARMAEAKTPAKKPEVDKTEAELKSGLGKWVSDYKEYRKAGNVKGAKEIKAKIESKIKSLGLNASKVWGEDPDKK